jgi:zinc D-Ala-D-Ala carboxypeptidase
MRAYEVTANPALNLREQPESSAQVLVQLKKGQVVARLDDVEWGAGWWRVFADPAGDTSAYEGYCAGRHLRPVTSTGQGGRQPAEPAPDPHSVTMLSETFSMADMTISETAARKGINNVPTGQELVNLKSTADRMEDLRRSLGGAVISISSAYRSRALNAEIGGSNNSDHTRGLAVDFTCSSLGTPYQVCQRIEAAGVKFDQLIHEFGRWVHIGFGSRMRQQSLTIFRGTGYRLGILTEAEARARV